MEKIIITIEKEKIPTIHLEDINKDSHIIIRDLKTGIIKGFVMGDENGHRLFDYRGHALSIYSLLKNLIKNNKDKYTFHVID